MENYQEFEKKVVYSRAKPPKPRRSHLRYCFSFGDGKMTQYKQFQRIDIVDLEGLELEQVIP
jgi:hypothetical protein